MTAQTLENLKFFINGHRLKSLAAAHHSRSNGHFVVASQHENEAAMAQQLLVELAQEKSDSL